MCSLGEQTIKGFSGPKGKCKIPVPEALTDLVWTRLDILSFDLSNCKASLFRMYASKFDGGRSRNV